MYFEGAVNLLSIIYQSTSTSLSSLIHEMEKSPISSLEPSPPASAGLENTVIIPPALLPIRPEDEKRLVRKCDLHVLPVITLLYLLAFIDRINIGNARIESLQSDLHMTGNDYNVALFVFFIPYILFELPSNIILKQVAPSTWLSSIMGIWGASPLLMSRTTCKHLICNIGVISICMGLTRSYAGLVTCRFLLGLFEAGFVPGSFDRVLTIASLN